MITITVHLFFSSPAYTLITFSFFPFELLLTDTPFDRLQEDLDELKAR